MPRGLSLQLASDRADLLNEAWKVGEGNRVDDVEVHRPVTVHDAIPQSNGLGPGDIRVLGTKGIRYLADGFADDGQVPQQGIARAETPR